MNVVSVEVSEVSEILKTTKYCKNVEIFSSALYISWQKQTISHSFVVDVEALTPYSILITVYEIHM